MSKKKLSGIPQGSKYLSPISRCSKYSKYSKNWGFSGPGKCVLNMIRITIIALKV